MTNIIYHDGDAYIDDLYIGLFHTTDGRIKVEAYNSEQEMLVHKKIRDANPEEQEEFKKIDIIAMERWRGKYIEHLPF